MVGEIPAIAVSRNREFRGGENSGAFEVVYTGGGGEQPTQSP